MFTKFGAWTIKWKILVGYWLILSHSLKEKNLLVRIFFEKESCVGKAYKKSGNQGKENLREWEVRGYLLHLGMGRQYIWECVDCELKIFMLKELAHEN